MQLKDSLFNQGITDMLFSWDFTCRAFLLVQQDHYSAQEVIPTFSRS